MIPKSRYIKQYSSAKDRFFRPALMNFFAKEFPRYFGPTIRENIANEIIHIFEKLNPESKRLKPGQILWNALDKNTRADSRNRKYVPVILTLINQEDIEELEKGVSFNNIIEKVTVRIIHEAYQQGGILSTRDVGLLTIRRPEHVGQIRRKYEEKNKTVLPHTGALHDMGSCITHKKQIIYKLVVERKDPVVVAGETNHSQKAVDHYYNDYNRVKTLYKDIQDMDHLHFIMNLAKPVIKQYIELFKKYENK